MKNNESEESGTNPYYDAAWERVTKRIQDLKEKHGERNVEFSEVVNTHNKKTKQLIEERLSLSGSGYKRIGDFQGDDGTTYEMYYKLKKRR